MSVYKNNRAKEWLQDCKKLKTTIAYCNEIINDPSVYQSPGFEERVSATGGNSTERKTNAVIARIGKAVQDRQKAMDELAKRHAAIQMLPDADEKIVLTLRYLKGYKWEQIEKWLHDHSRTDDVNVWAISTLYAIHKSALGHIKIIE